MCKKPCPFCGSEDLRESKNFSVTKCGELKKNIVCVECNNCGCNGPTIVFIVDAIQAWNDRNSRQQKKSQSYD